MSIVPRDTVYMNSKVEGIPLRVIMRDGVKYTPDIKFNSLDLNSGIRIFRNESGETDSFTVSVLLNINDTVKLDDVADYSDVAADDTGEVISQSNPLYEYQDNNISLIRLLDYYIRSGMPFYVYTKAIGINSDVLWLITEQKSRKQTHDVVTLTDITGESYESGYVEWDLEFTRYNELEMYVWKNTNKGVTSALKAYDKKQKDKAKKAAAKKTTAKSKTTDVAKLEKCDYKKITYSKTKKTSDCVKTLQKILDKKGCFGKTKVNQIDGWYGDSTKKAVKKYQTDNKSKWGLNPTGNLDKTTYNCLCGNPPKQIGKTKTVGASNANKVIVTQGTQVKSVPKANNTIS